MVLQLKLCGTTAQKRVLHLLTCLKIAAWSFAIEQVEKITLNGGRLQFIQQSLVHVNYLLMSFFE